MNSLGHCRWIFTRGQVPDCATNHGIVRVPPDDYETLLRRVWSGRDGANSHLVRIFVRTLRRNLGEDATNPAWIFNERGVGYRMAAPGEG